MSKFFSSILRPFAVFGLSFLLLGWGTVNIFRYNSFVSALQQSEKLPSDVLAENDSVEDLLITFNYETIFAQPVEFQKDITAPNILYSLSAGDGIEISGDAQKPTINNTGVLSVNGKSGEVTIAAGENVELVEEDGVLTIKSTVTDTDTDTKLSETEVEDFIFDGESTGVFADLQIGDILLSDAGSSATTSGSSLVGVYQGNLSEISGTTVQEVIDSIDSTLASLGTSSHGEVTFAGTLDYLTLTGQQITLNQIDLTTDVVGDLPIANGGTGSNTVTGARNNMGLGTGDTVGFGRVGVGTTNPSYPLSIEADNPSSVTMSMQNTSNTGWTSIRYYDDAGVRSASFGYGNTGAAKFKDIAYIQTYQPTTSIAFATNSTDRIFITPTGDVGVGTTTPSAKLEVIGDIVGSTVSDGTVSITGGNITGAGNITAGGVVTGTGSGLTGLNASNLSSGTVPDARVSGSYTGLANVTGSGTATFGTFSGSGSSLTSLNASNLSAGTVASGRLSGSYTGITGVGTISTGTWQGSVINSAYLDTNVILSSEINTSAELAAIVTDETGSGALVFANTPTFTNTLKITDSSSSKLIFDSLGSGMWGNVITSTNNAETTGVGLGVGGNSSMTSIPRFVLNVDDSYVGWAMRPGDGAALGSTNGDGNLYVRGNLGVGTSNPAGKFEVAGSALSVNVNELGELGVGDTGSNLGVGLKVRYGQNTAVGGTFYEVAELENSYATAGRGTGLVLKSDETDGSRRRAGIQARRDAADTGRLEFFTSPSLNTLTLAMTIDDSQQVGIGTGSPGSKLSVSGGQTIGASYATYAAPTNGLVVQGNVGIGTSSPGATLDVQGAAQFGSGNVDLINSTGKIPAINSSYFASVDGSALTNLNASNLSSGTVPSARISGSYTGITGTGALAAGSISSGFGNIDIGTSTFTGNGSGLTTLNASNLSSGTVASARVSGSYTGITGVGTISAGTWQGGVISATYLDASLLTSADINTSAELRTIVTDETGSGALVFGTSPSLTTPNIGAATGTSLNVSGAITAGGVVTGTGSGLSGLNASNLSSGTVPDARISGAYTGLTNITGSGAATFGSFSGNGSSLTSLNASNLSSGTVASARVSGSYTGITGTGALNAGSISSGFGNINIGTSTFTGNGSGLTTLNASNLSSGTVASARISGSYTGITGVGTISAGTWQGSVISATYLDASLLTSADINTSAEIKAIVTDETGSGALVFGTSPSLTTPNIGAASGSSLTLTGNGSGSRFLAGTGGASAPGISFSGDTNTGIFNNTTLGNDYLGFAVGGSQRMSITSLGSGGVVNIGDDTYPSGGSQGLYVAGASGSNAGNNNMVVVKMTNTLSDDGPFTQSALYSEMTNSGADYSSDVRAIYGKVTNSQTTTSRIQESYGLYGEAIGNTNGSSSYAYGVYCSSTGADFNYCGGNQTWTNTSDRRVKTDISTIEGALDIVNSIRGVRFRRTDDGSKEMQIGFIAQEVLPYVPEAVHFNPANDLYAMGYAEMTAVLVNAVKEQNEIVLTNKSNIQTADIRLDDAGEVLAVVNIQTQELLAGQSNILNQINLEKNIQDTKMASQAASLETIQDRVKTIEKMTNDTEAVIAGLQDRVSQLESIFATQTATDAASLGANSGDVLGISDQIDLETLTVTGDTNINNLGVTGDITAGLLSIKGFDDELATPSAIISTISGPLKIQDQAAGSLDIMGGKVLIDTDGNILVRGSITVNKLNIDESDETSKSVGEGIITSGQNEVKINTTSVTNTSKIFVTGKNVISTPIVVTEKVPGESFTVKVANTAESDIPFDWLIVN